MNALISLHKFRQELTHSFIVAVEEIINRLFVISSEAEIVITNVFRGEAPLIIYYAGFRDASSSCQSWIVVKVESWLCGSL